jgi:hypothetical protein
MRNAQTNRLTPVSWLEPEIRIQRQHLSGGVVGFTAVIAVTIVGSATALAAARLQAGTLAAWDVYVRATETRIARELKSSEGFLALDFRGDAAVMRRALVAGEVTAQSMDAPRVDGRPVDTPSGRVEHWLGAVLIPGMTASQLIARLEQAPPPSEDVLQSAVLERGPDWMFVSMRLQRKSIVTVTYDTVHVVTFSTVSPSRATSTSTAVRIREIGEDHGFLWRLNAYWRYEDVPGGVIAECESITLSRDIPSLVRFIVSPVVERTARETMTKTLVTLRGVETHNR